MHFSISFDKHEHTWGPVEFGHRRNFKYHRAERKAQQKCLRCCAARDVSREELVELLYDALGQPEPTL